MIYMNKGNFNNYLIFCYFIIKIITMVLLLMVLLCNLSKSDVVYLEENELLSVNFGIGSNYKILGDIENLPK